MSPFASIAGLPRFAVATGVAVAVFAPTGIDVQPVARHRRVVGRRVERRPLSAPSSWWTSSR